MSLSVWNRWEQWRETKRKLKEAEPWAALRLLTKSSHPGHWRCNVLFTNTKRARLLITHAKLIAPKGYGITRQLEDAAHTVINE